MRYSNPLFAKSAATQHHVVAGGYLYHVTYLGNLDSIAQQGLVPNADTSIGGPALRGYKSGKVFLTDAGGVDFWLNRAEMFAYNDSDNLAEDGRIPVVLRVRAPRNPVKDEEGSNDSGHGAFYCSGVKSAIEVWTGNKWQSIYSTNLDPQQYVDEEGYIIQNSPLNSPKLAAKDAMNETPSAPIGKKTLLAGASNHMEFSWNNYLLYRKIAGSFDTKDDLDSYDSEVAHDLYELHDQIMQNPLRGAYTQGSEYYQQRGFDFTYKALKNRLIPAVRAVGLDTGNKDVARDLAKATAELTRAERYGRVGAYEEAGPHLERAFGFVHNAIDRVRYATRKVPAVRSLKPLNPMWASLKTAWRVGETTDRAGRTVHVYLWLYVNDKLYVSDEHNYHEEMASDFNVATDDLVTVGWDEDSSRGMIILHPETRTGEVMMYEGGSHSDAGFIPNDVWDSITYKFKKYKLEEKSGLSEAVSSGRSNGVPDTKPKYAPTFASQNPKVGK